MTSSMPHYNRIAVFGGIYSNHLALAAAIEDARSRGVDGIMCLGDLGAFGPNPDKVFPLLRANDVSVVKGNYDDSVAKALDDCQCGYTDPRDNHFARLSYQYTLSRTALENRTWMGDLPEALRFRLGDLEALACHGSPRRMNEFLWESSTPTHFLDKLATDVEADVVLGTHTGLHWWRQWGDAKSFVNVGVLGRPANDGRTNVWYALIEAEGRRLAVDFIPVHYDHEALANEMRDEELPEQFVETILTGWWTTCLEILPGKERAVGRF
ncbi:MAG: metallophosphoesterase family protein [Gemmatimonadetes bacterium]|nr:metallophosphoesterase family protein [Gemmatimonadota bacterium]MDA1102628.1 metallophosphoesterase family protein [Gemmatimonadota bacterium]